MPENQKIEQSVRKLLSSRNDLSERRMFGGLAFMVSGNMLCAVGKDHLMVRVGPDQYKTALAFVTSLPPKEKRQSKEGHKGRKGKRT